ncbi:MAG: methionyl-tRNA formyltransferase [Bacteroidota bacterium]
MSGLLKKITQLVTGKRSLRIVFMGSPEFAVPSLEALYNSNHKIVKVYSNPDRRRGRGSNTEPTAVKAKARELGLPTGDVEKTDDPALVDELEKLKPDLLVVVAFRILPDALLAIPTKGAINLHASLLPRYRGAAPIHWAIRNGEYKTGCTVFFLEQEVDTGAIIGQVEARIDPDETTGELYERLRRIGADLLVECVDRIASGKVDPVLQDDAQASGAPKLFRDDAHIDFQGEATSVYNHIRSMIPHPGAWTLYGNQKVQILRARLGPEIDLTPGELIFAEGRYLLVGCGSGTVEIKDLKLPGKSRISGKDFANGYSLTPGFK